MIDLHSHLLPGRADGARALDDTLRPAWIAVAEGSPHGVFTPMLAPVGTATMHGIYVMPTISWGGRRFGAGTRGVPGS